GSSAGRLLGASARRRAALPVGAAIRPASFPQFLRSFAPPFLRSSFTPVLESYSACRLVGRSAGRRVSSSAGRLASRGSDPPYLVSSVPHPPFLRSSVPPLLLYAGPRQLFGLSAGRLASTTACRLVS